MLEKIDEDLKQAMLDRDIAKTSVLRMVKGALQNQSIENRGTLTEDDALKVLTKEVKKRKEAAEMYAKADDELRASTELAEAEIIQAYLPEQMSEADIRKVVDEVVSQMGKDNMGQVMGAVMGKLKGQADGGTVSAIVKEVISS